MFVTQAPTTPPAAEATPTVRRTDLDLLRIVVCFSVILAHALLIFGAEPNYHVKSAMPWPVASVVYEFMRIATLAIFFVLAGWSAVGSLRRRSWTRYLKDRVQRIFVPLVAGMLLLGPVIKWIELGQGRDLRLGGFRLVPPPEIDFVAFLARYYTRGDTLTWSHLWFLAYLLVISLALLPLLLVLAKRVPEGRVPGRAMAYAPALILVGYIVATEAYWPFLPRLVGDWANLGYFSLCFAGGAVLACWPGMEERLKAEGVWLAGLSFVGLALVVLAGEGIVGRIGVGLCAWGAIGGGLGLAARWRPAPSPLMTWMGEATMPVYVLHHIPVLALGVLMLPWGWAPWWTVLVITVVATVISLLAYRWLVQPWSWVRVAMGMDAQPRAAARTQPPR